MRASHETLLSRLTSAGYRRTSFSVESEGAYDVADADWNYKDVPHLNVVHTRVRAIVGSLDADVITTINLQKVLGISVPVTLVNYATGDDAQTYFTTLGPFVIVVSTRYEASAAGRTLVRTTYDVAAAPIWSIFFPLVRRQLRKNYEVLMSEDLPMRERRGTLRERAFTFRSDGRARTFSETTDLRVDNVVAPERAATAQHAIDIGRRLARPGDEALIGPDDDRGVRAVRLSEGIALFARYCAHEGASLDCSVMKSNRLRCPWHGKSIEATAHLLAVDGATVRSGSLSAKVAGGILLVTLPDGERATRSRDETEHEIGAAAPNHEGRDPLGPSLKK